MAKKQFKAESKRLLDLMINSIYTHKEKRAPRARRGCQEQPALQGRRAPRAR